MEQPAALISSDTVPSVFNGGAALPLRRESVYFPYFDWLRGLLAVAVVLAHVGVLTWGRAGDFAVQIFFALSGWLIGGILLNLPRGQIARFYFNRSIRIWVPYYIALILLLSVGLMHDVITSKWIEFAVYKATFVYNWFGPEQLAQFRAYMPLQGTGNHFWSVNTEEQFYVIAPMLLVILPAKLGRNIITWLVLTAAGLALNQYSSILMGVLAAVAVHQYGPIHERPAVRWVSGAVAVLTFAAIWEGWSYQWLAAPCALAIVLSLAVRGRPSTAGSIVGGMSYPLYLNQWIGVFVANFILNRTGHAQSQGLMVAISVPFSIALAVAMYWFIDLRLHQFRSRLFTPRRGRMAMAASYVLIALGLAYHLHALHTPPPVGAR